MLAEKCSQGSIILLDSLELRRESIRSLLEPWSFSLSLEFVVMAPESLSESDTRLGPARIRLVVLIVGGSLLSDQPQQDAMSRVKQMLPDVPCAVLSDSRDPEEAICAASAGMQAFLSSAMPPAIANQALAFVLGGGSYFPREALLASKSGSGHTSFGRATDLTHAGLTTRQCDVLERLRYGKSNKHIARELNMQEATVKVHVRQIMRKLGAANRTQVALLAQSSERSSQAAQQTSGLPPTTMLATPSGDRASLSAG